MKQLTTIFSLLFILSLISVQNIAAQVQVRIGVPPPRAVVIERPVCPGRDYVWVDGHYIYDRYTRRDVWIPGQWEYIAPRRNDRRFEREDRHRGHGRSHESNQRFRKDRRYEKWD